MRIDLNRSISATYGSEASSQASAQASHSATEAQPSNQAGEAAKLSWGANSMKALTARVHQLPGMRQERVAALAQIVRGGAYQVSSEQVAEALMSHMSAAGTG